MLPVEKMAARVLYRQGLKPPYSLEDLVRKYGDVEYHLFPFEADGITAGIGGNSKPQILINTTITITRKKFTLAHELGHIIIPWHTGTIVSKIKYDLDAHMEYRKMETEANKFAAELLIPSLWAKNELHKFESYEEYLNYILDTTSVSRDAVLIKVFRVIEEPVICLQFDDDDGDVIDSYTTSTAPSAHISNIMEMDNFQTQYKIETFSLGDRNYRLLAFKEEVTEETDERSWRDILYVILSETGCQDLQQSINATLPTKFNSNKTKSINEICNAVLRHFDGKDKFSKVIAHPFFKQYVVKRVKELVLKYKT